MKKQILNEDFKRMQYLAGILGESLLNEEDMYEEIESAFQKTPNTLPWNVIENTYQESGLSGEEFFTDYEDEFKSQFEGKPVSRDEYYKFYTERATGGQDDLFTMINWINFTNPELADQLFSKI